MTTRRELVPTIRVAGLRIALAPEGNPETDNDTVCVFPLVIVLETVMLPVLPEPTFKVVLLDASEKSLGTAPPLEMKVTSSNKV